MERFLKFLQNLSIFAAVFLVPLVFAPWTFEAFEFNKQYLLVFAVALGVFSWVAKMVLVEREIHLKRTPLDLPILVFFLVSAASAVFSVDTWSSLLGYYGRFSDGILGVAAFVGLYFLIVNTQEKPQKLVRWFLLAASISLAAAYASFLGLWEFVAGMPQIMQQGSFNPAAASAEGFAVFLAALLVFLAFQAVRPEVKQLPKAVHLLLLFFGFAYLLMVDIQKAWIVLLAGLLFVLAASLLYRQRRALSGGIKRLWLPLALLLVTVVFLFSPTPIPSASSGGTGQAKIPQEPMLSQSISWSIAWQTVTENPKTALVGSGQGTFGIDFSQHRPESFNSLPEWQNRFDRAGSFLQELLATTGFLGFVSFLGVVGLFLLLSWYLMREGKGAHFAVGVIALLITQLVYYQTTVLGLAFWLFLAASVLSFERPAKEFVLSLRRFPEVEVMGKGVLLVLLALVAGLFFFGAKFYLADAQYLKAQNTPPAESVKRITAAREAVRLNPYQAEYKIFLSRLYLGRALSELRKPEGEQEKPQISRDVQLAIAYARGDEVKCQMSNVKCQIVGAVELAPSRVAAWETLGAVYRDITFAAGALDWAIRSFDNAIALEPTNPVLYTELGKLYLSNEQLAKAREQFEKAIELKSDYVEAHRQNALVFEREGDTGTALAKLQELSLRYPLDVETSFQLGRLYYNAGQVPEAINRFREILEAAPNHSNARFALGVALENQGKTKEAILEFQRVLELNPGNQTVRQKLQDLRE